MRLPWIPVVGAVLLAMAAPAARAQDTLPPAALERQIFRAFEAGRYERAAELIEQYLEGSPGHPIMLYNAACAYARLGERDKAATRLYQAVEAGFLDFDQMARDPDLASIRDHGTYLAIVEASKRVRDRAAKGALRHWKATYGTEHYRYDEDEERRLQYAIALDPVSYQEMRRMIEREADHLIDTLFGAPPGYFVLIAVPTTDDALQLFAGDELVGGIYEHDRRRLVARDIGTALRHEFFHVMHYGHMQRLGQEHPIWIQEGLATLYEDYEWRRDGSIRFLPNQRHNIVRNRARAGRLTSWSRLVRLSADEFMDRSGFLYPQARSIFEYVADRGRLEAWYRTYVEHFDADRTGVTAFELTFGESLEAIERDWKRWVAARPAVDVEVDQGDAILGIETSFRTSNDGVLVKQVLRGLAAERAGVRPGDVIVAVDGRPTRSLIELRIAIGDRRVGEQVRVRLRREGRYLTLTLTLRPVGRPRMVP